MSLRSLPRAVTDVLRHASREGVSLSRFSTFEPAGARPMSVVSERFPASAAPPLTRAAGDTPLPALSIVVLSITLMGEFLTANVSMPFLLFMVKGFTDMKGVDDVSSSTGALLASFFVGQFVTSLLWANIAQRTNNRLVLTLSLLGTTVASCLFGMTTTLTQAIVVRLFQGVFAGAIGVARGCVSGITDASNENRAYAILGFCWGLGGVAGAIIGGIFESPASKWPTVFASQPIFVAFPYLLPTAIAAFVTFVGAILSCFLAPDGGPRYRAPLPPVEKTVVFDLPPTIHEGEPLLSTATSAPAQFEADAETGERPSRIARGYGAVNAAHNASRRQSIDSSRYPQRRTNASRTSLYETAGIVERVALANEHHVSQISDLWVAGAMSTELEDEDRTELDNSLLPAHDGAGNFGAVAPIPFVHTLSWTDMFSSSAEPDAPTAPGAAVKQPPFPAGKGPLPSDFGACTRPLRRAPRAPSLSRRALTLSRTQTQSTTGGGWGRGMNARTLSLTRTRTRDCDGDEEDDDDEKGEGSPFWALPWLVIAQYGLIALHSATHDMVFMSYFFSEVKLGGLGLAASDFSLLTAVMCLFQIAYQFYLYPTLGAHLSHLSMLQLGTGLYCIAYIASPGLHFLASSGESGVDLNAGLIMVTALRYGGTTLGYTALAILINRMSPPPVVGLANGIAQSVLSLARCLGPLLGGYIWATATDGNSAGMFVPFFSVAGMCVFALVTSLAIR